MDAVIDWFDSDAIGPDLVLALGIVILALVVHLITRAVVPRVLGRAVALSAKDWDDVFVEQGLFRRLASLPGLIVILVGVPQLEGLPSWVTTLVGRVTLVVVAVVVLRAIYAALDAVNQIYNGFEFAAERPIKGYLQLVKLILAVITGVLAISFLADRSPGLLLSGIGAATAVLLLVFKDTILSLVASLQLASNDMVRVGDWITVEGRGADGDVIDIALHTIKIRNFDNTIVSLPTHVLTTESFVNWRGMSESGGRRIKRALYLDMRSVRFLTRDEIDAFSQWPLLADHVDAKRRELAVDTDGHDPDAAATRGARRLTNLGMFRAYCEAYLRRRPDIHQAGMTLMVRQLAPGPEGIPLELYAFTTTTDWTRYEGIQADVFDHLLAILHRFDLRVHQRPGSADVADLVPPDGLLAGLGAASIAVDLPVD